MVLRGLSFSVAVWLAAAGAPYLSAAEDKSAASAESPLVAAKRDYSAMGTTQIEVDQANALKSFRTVPPLETSTEGAPSLSPIQRARMTERRKSEAGAGPSRTWLIDAVQENSKERSARGTSMQKRESVEADLGSSLDEELTVESKAAWGVSPSRESEAAGPQRTTPAAEVRNPLDSFMAQWMTAKDFEVLRTMRERSGESIMSVEPPSSGSVPGQGSARFGSLDRGIRSHVFAHQVSPLNRLAAENPYVVAAAGQPLAQSEHVPAPEIHQPAGLVLPAPIPLLQSGPAMIAPPNSPPSEPWSADLLKGQGDARYFKQLKRF